MVTAVLGTRQRDGSSKQSNLSWIQVQGSRLLAAEIKITIIAKLGPAQKKMILTLRLKDGGNRNHNK